MEPNPALRAQEQQIEAMESLLLEIVCVIRGVRVTSTG